MKQFSEKNKESSDEGTEVVNKSNKLYKWLLSFPVSFLKNKNHMT